MFTPNFGTEERLKPYSLNLRVAQTNSPFYSRPNDSLEWLIWDEFANIHDKNSHKDILHSIKVPYDICAKSIELRKSYILITFYLRDIKISCLLGNQ